MISVIGTPMIQSTMERIIFSFYEYTLIAL